MKKAMLILSLMAMILLVACGGSDRETPEDLPTEEPVPQEPVATEPAPAEPLQPSDPLPTAGAYPEPPLPDSGPQLEPGDPYPPPGAEDAYLPPTAGPPPTQPPVDYPPPLVPTSPPDAGSGQGIWVIQPAGIQCEEPLYPDLDSAVASLKAAGIAVMISKSTMLNVCDACNCATPLHFQALIAETDVAKAQALGWTVE
jgi:hypothetical protein